jgi:dihydrofolate reductase
MIAIVAVDNDWGIGLGGKLPWHIPGDLAFFKEQTLGHIVVMGRKTFESLPGGALPGRVNVVLTRDTSFTVPSSCSELAPSAERVRNGFPAEGVFVVHSAYELFDSFGCGPCAADSVGGFESYGRQDGESCLSRGAEATGRGSFPARKIFVAGGAEIYRLLLPFTKKCLVTKVDTRAGADTFFPDLDADENFNIIEVSDLMDEGGLEYYFVVYENKFEAFYGEN